MTTRKLKFRKNKLHKRTKRNKITKRYKKLGGVGSSSKTSSEKCKICCQEVVHKKGQKYYNVLPGTDCEHYYTMKTKNGAEFYALRTRKGNAQDKSHCTENNSIFIKEKLQKCPADKYSDLYQKHLKRYNVPKMSTSAPPLVRRISSRRRSSSDGSSRIVTTRGNTSFGDSGPRVMSSQAAEDLARRPAAYY